MDYRRNRKFDFPGEILVIFFLSRFFENNFQVKSLKFLDHKYAFDVCQSLRFIEYGNKKLFRNVITKEIEELSNDEETRLIELPSFYWPRY